MRGEHHPTGGGERGDGHLALESLQLGRRDSSHAPSPRDRCQAPQILRVSVDELIGYQPVATPAGRANPRLWRRLRQVEALPPPDRKHVLQLIDTLVERETLKKRSTKGG